jgi:hypothetical protein
MEAAQREADEIVEREMAEREEIQQNQEGDDK